MNPLSQAVISGVMMGSVYALLATGLVIVYHTSQIMNIAHGEAYAVAGIVAALAAGHSLPVWLALLAGIAAAVAFALSLEWGILRPRRAWSVNGLILVTLAVAFFMRGVLNVSVGADPVSFPGLVSGRALRVAGGALPRQGLLLVVVGLAAALAIPLFLSATRLGRQLRAAAENPDAAELMGVDVDRARTIAFAVAGAYGALGALLLVPLISVDFQSGLGMTMRGFIAAALGGMSPLPVILCGLGLGLAEALVNTYVGALAQDPIVFLALIAVALWQSRRVRFGGSLRA
ncbi:MAG TPA: branched-chain amino acid ABC transporter permease [Stellaceae bacterium]|nr:branched-chain amino acid ABC transporter permease [Stellaceae bacterium]